MDAGRSRRYRRWIDSSKILTTSPGSTPGKPNPSPPMGGGPKVNARIRSFKIRRRGTNLQPNQPMKITLSINNDHAPTLIQLLAKLLAKSETATEHADPAPGHPELPLAIAETTRQPIEPEAGKQYRTRSGIALACVDKWETDEAIMSGVFGSIWYDKTGRPRYGSPLRSDDGWDLVEEIPDHSENYFDVPTPEQAAENDN